VWYNVSQLEDRKAGATLIPWRSVVYDALLSQNSLPPQALTFDDVLHSVFMAKEVPNYQLPQ